MPWKNTSRPSAFLRVSLTYEREAHVVLHEQGEGEPHLAQPARIDADLLAEADHRATPLNNEPAIAGRAKWHRPNRGWKRREG